MDVPRGVAEGLNQKWYPHLKRKTSSLILFTTHLAHPKSKSTRMDGVLALSFFWCQKAALISVSSGSLPLGPPRAHHCWNGVVQNLHHTARHFCGKHFPPFLASPLYSSPCSLFTTVLMLLVALGWRRWRCPPGLPPRALPRSTRAPRFLPPPPDHAWGRQTGPGPASGSA